MKQFASNDIHSDIYKLIKEAESIKVSLIDNPPNNLLNNPTSPNFLKAIVEKLGKIGKAIADLFRKIERNPIVPEAQIFKKSDLEIAGKMEKATKRLNTIDNKYQKIRTKVKNQIEKGR